MVSVAFFAYAQESLSGRYDADDEDSLYAYFDFTSRNAVRVGMQFAGFASTVRARYTIEDGYVIIEYNGDTVELKIVNANTLEGEDFPVDGIRFNKRR
jgi:hypothetical protein